MEKQRFVTLNLSNGDFFGEIANFDVADLVLQGYIRKEVDNIFVVTKDEYLDYLEKFYTIE
jgi:hypothetical protein